MEESRLEKIIGGMLAIGFGTIVGLLLLEFYFIG